MMGISLRFRWVARTLAYCAVTALLGEHSADAQGASASFEDHVRLGEYYLQRKIAGRAISEFETAVRLRSDSALAHYDLGAALRLWGDSIAAETALREALRLQPRFPEAHYVLGLVLGDYVGSESRGLHEFQAALAENPDFADAHFNVGVILRKLNDVDGSIESFRRAVRLRSDDAEFRFRLGQSLATAGQLANAARELEQAIEIDPAHVGAHYQLVLIYKKLDENKKAETIGETLGRLLTEGAKSANGDRSGFEYETGRTSLEQGHVDDSIERLTQALKNARDECKVRLALGIAWQRIGKLEAAENEFRKALELRPGSADAHVNMGVLLMRRGQISIAETEFRSAIGLDPNFAEAYFDLGLNMASQHHWPEAAEFLGTTVRLDPGNARAHWNLGRVRRDSGDTGGALDSYRTSWQLNQSEPELAVEYGGLLLAQGQRNEALMVWRQAWKRNALSAALQESIANDLDSKSDHEEARRQRQIFDSIAHSSYARGLELLNRGEVEGAVGVFRDLLRVQPDWSPVRWSLAYALFSQRRYLAAAEEYRKLVEEDPADADLRLQLGVALREIPALDQARQELEASIRLNPHSAQGYYHLGLVYLAATDTGRAMKQFHVARRIDPRLQPPPGLHPAH